MEDRFEERFEGTISQLCEGTENMELASDAAVDDVREVAIELSVLMEPRCECP